MKKEIKMKKNLLYTILSAGALMFATSCSDFLETSSPSDADPDFVFSNPVMARAALENAYERWRADAFVHSNGLFYDLCVAGSDSERHPEAFAGQIRHIPENLYPNGPDRFDINFSDAQRAWTSLYSIVAITNTLINQFEASADFETYMNAGQPSALSHLYGEAVALRATAYMELTRFFGDVPHQLKAGEQATGFTSRDAVYEYHINKLVEVEPLMYRLKEEGTITTTMTRTYVQGLIGRICLYAGGYATRRTDLPDLYKDLAGNPISFIEMYKDGKSTYSRRSDYQRFYEIAKKALQDCVDNSGGAKLITVDTRSASSAGQVFANPYQLVFQQMMMGDAVYSEESIYEIPESYGVQTERPYAFGRPSDGAGRNAYPCKSYGQSRFHPTYYYGDFDPKDMRRDVTVTTTGSDGNGNEKIISFAMGSVTIGGGLSNNKWDENRMTTVRVENQRQSGVNNPYMRVSEVILMLAEVKAELGDEAGAKAELRKVRERAFPTAADANVDGFIARCGGIKEAIAQERKLEFGGEGLRRYDLIRTGKLPEAIAKVRQELANMVSGLETNGYYTFDNGNTISNYIWTKKVDAKAQHGYRLTTQAPDESDPVLYPSWRGQNDSWESYGLVYASTNTNLAIKGLFKYIDPNGAEAAALEADGYVKTKWGIEIVDNKAEYSSHVFSGYQQGTPPIYLMPLHTNTILTSEGALSNGYGFAQQQ